MKSEFKPIGTNVQQCNPLVTAQEQLTESQRSPMPIPSDKSPQEFYDKTTQRPNVRAILEELATG
ncbi:MAG: hypothetical protein M3464_00580 [Chloroflexota bacterium]|nr:hypothetical protein [Chloroflexota bacterium]